MASIASCVFFSLIAILAFSCDLYAEVARSKYFEVNANWGDVRDLHDGHPIKRELYDYFDRSSKNQGVVHMVLSNRVGEFKPSYAYFGHSGYPSEVTLFIRKGIPHAAQKSSVGALLFAGKLVDNHERYNAVIIEGQTKNLSPNEIVESLILLDCEIYNYIVEAFATGGWVDFWPEGKKGFIRMRRYVWGKHLLESQKYPMDELSLEDLEHCNCFFRIEKVLLERFSEE